MDARLLQKNSMMLSTSYIVWMNFSSISYHCNHLVANLQKGCRFCVLPFLKKIPDNILKSVRVAYPWDTTAFTPTLTGVPPHVLLMLEIEIIRRKYYDIQKGIKSDMNKMLD